MSGNDLCIDDISADEVLVNVERVQGISESDDEKLNIDDGEMDTSTLNKPKTENDDAVLEENIMGVSVSYLSLSNSNEVNNGNKVSQKLDIDYKLDLAAFESSDRSMSCVMDLPPDTEPRLANQHSFKTTYRLTNDEIGHRTLNPQAPVNGEFERPNTRYRQSSLHNPRETINRDSLPRLSQYRQMQNLEHSRETINRSNLPGESSGQASAVQRNRTWSEQKVDDEQPSRSIRTGDAPQSPRYTTFFLSSLPPTEPSPREERWFRMTIDAPREQPRSQRFVRWVNHNPFFHIDRIFAGMPGFFGFNRGFDDDGHFFFSVNIPQQRDGPPKATSDQIEKAVSQLKGVSSDMELRKDDRCPICLDEFDSEDDVVEMPCPCKRTFFHRDCAIQTLEKTKKIKCPNCRKWDGSS